MNLDIIHPPGTPYAILPPTTWLPTQQAIAAVEHFPRHLGKAIRREWIRRRNVSPARRHVWSAFSDYRGHDADQWARQLVTMFPADALALGASEETLVDYAKAKAAEIDRLLVAGADMDTLRQFCRQHGIELPNGDTEQGIARRAACSLWWRRNLRRVNARKSEALSIALGLVHKRSGLYCSHDSVNRRKEQKRRNRALLEALTAINELGESFSLVDIADKGMSNPAIKRAELMVRIAGFEHIAVGLDYAGEFITLTAPSHYHPRRAASGQRNPKYDQTSTPRDTAQYLGKVWSRITAALDRAEIKIFGFRVAEPHHDGTPHFHGLFFMPPAQVQPFRRIVARYAVREDRAELGLSYALTQGIAMEIARERKAAGHTGKLGDIAACVGTEAAFWQNPPRGAWKQVSARVDFKAIDWSRGTAAGYIAKYIAKNVDGKKTTGDSIGQDWEALGGVSDGDDGATRDQYAATDATATARRVDAWAATWGIRQFQQVGGPPVGVWRELRRWEFTDAADVLLHATVAADTGNWGRFVQVMGGHEKRRREMPLQMAKDSEPATNRYGEPGQKRTFGVVEVASGQLAVTRMHEWTIKRGEAVLGREASPWTRVNNSTKCQIPAATTPEATQEDLQRWLDDIDASDRRMGIRPADDSFAAPDMLRERQQRDRQRLAEGEQLMRDVQRARQTDLSSFMGTVNAWVNESAITADRARAATLKRLAERDTRRRITAHFSENTHAGLDELQAIRAEALGSMRPRPQPTASRTWKAPDGCSQTISSQLAGAVNAANRWLVQIQSHINHPGEEE